MALDFSDRASNGLDFSDRAAPAGKKPVPRKEPYKPVTLADLQASGIAPKKKRGAMDEVYGAVATFNRTVPGLDEAGDGLQALIDLAGGNADNLGDAWTKARARSKAGSSDFQERRPIVASQVKGAGNSVLIVPALMTGGAAAAPAATTEGVPMLGNLGQLLTGPTARAALAGGGTSALAGYADEGSAEERLNAGNDAVVPGAMTGLGLSLAAKTAGPLADAVIRRFAPAEERSAGRAGRILAARVPAATKPVPRLEPGQLPFQQMGPGGKSLARAVANVPGPGQGIAERAIAQGRKEAPGRMLQSLTREMGDDGSRFYQSLDDLDAARKSASKPFYDAFEQEPVFLSDVENKLAPMLNTKMGRSALSSAERLAEADAVIRGEPFRGLGVVIDDGGIRFAEVPTPRTLDYIKKGFDDALGAHRDVFGRLNPTTEARTMDQFRGEFVRRLDEMFPNSYPKARAAYAGPTEQIKAMERGRKLAKGGTDAELIERGTGRMSKDARDAQALGVARELSDQFRNGRPKTALRKLDENMVLQDQLRAAMGDDAAFASFMDDVAREADNFRAYDDIMSGSRTTPLREDIDAANSAGEALFDRVQAVGERRLAGQSFRNQIGGAALRTAEGVRTPGLRDEVTNRLLAEVLFGKRAPEEVLQAAVLQRVMTPEQAKVMLPLLTRAVTQSQASAAQR